LARAWVIALAALALTGCGGGGDDESTAIDDAALATEQARGWSFANTTTMTVEGLPKPIVVRSSGVEDVAGRSAQASGTYSNYPGPPIGTKTRGPVSIEVVTILPDAYLKSPIFARALPDGKHWLHVDITRPSPQIGLRDPSRLAGGNPLQALRATGGPIERSGDHYRMRVDLRKLPELARPAERAYAEQSADYLIRLLGTDTYPLEVWLDEWGRVRKTRSELKLTLRGRASTVVSTTEMFDFGSKPRPQAPPPGDTYDASR
jgi:hypothetical protein